MRATILVAALSLATPLVASDFLMELPVDCRLGDTCYIQQYMDRDPGPGARDFACGTLSYDGHKGTDFALPTLADMTRGVDVLAVAPGRVQAARDNMADVLYSAENAANTKGRECGNGIVLKHQGGFETQYCHLRQGSVTVQSGDVVAAGDVLGQIGLSGKTQFPHLHLSVRRDGVEIDPFDPEMRNSCSTDVPDLWADPAPDYLPGGLIDVGLSDTVPEYDAIKAGTAAVDTLPPDAPALVIFGFAFGAQDGDTMRLEIVGPNGPVIQREIEFGKNQAQLFRAIGKRRSETPWPSGQYLGRVELWRGLELLDKNALAITIE